MDSVGLTYVRSKQALVGTRLFGSRHGKKSSKAWHWTPLSALLSLSFIPFWTKDHSVVLFTLTINIPVLIFLGVPWDFNLKIQGIAAITKSLTLYTLLLSSHCNSTTESLQKRPLVYYNSRHSALTLERGVFILGLRYILLWTPLGLRTYGASKHLSVLGSLVRAMEKK